MCRSIYKTFANDFEFVNKYGFINYIKIESYIAPSITFINANIELQIGMDYETKKMFVILYHDQNYRQGVDLLKNVQLKGKSYKEQVEQVKIIVDDFLKNNQDN